MHHGSWQTFRKVSLAGIEPVGFRVKSDLRTSNHQAIVQPRLYDSLPRLYDSLMVTQITLVVPTTRTATASEEATEPEGIERRTPTPTLPAGRPWSGPAEFHRHPPGGGVERHNREK